MSNNQTELHPLYGSIKKTEYAVIDIESKDGETQNAGFTRPFLVGYYDGDKFVSWYGDDCIKDCINHVLTNDNDGMRFYAHFGGIFDWLHFLPLLKSLGFGFEIIATQSKIQMIKIKRNNKSHRKGWTFLDSGQIIPTGLKAISKTFNVKVKKMEEMDLNTHELDPIWIEYLRDDCISLYQVIDKYTDLIENTFKGELGITAASTAMKTFRRSYLEYPIERHVKDHDLFRRTYYGGRVEIFREKGDNIRYYDINSSYPFSMLSEMPVGKKITWEGDNIPEWLAEEYIGYIDADVNVATNVHIPVLPYRHENKLIFPVGKFSGCWVYDELKLAMENGATANFKKSVWIKKRPLFNNYINDMYRYRDKSLDTYDEALSWTAKLMMNVLYGKFGTNEMRESVLILEDDEEIPDGASPALPEDPECRIFMVPTELKAGYIIPQISSYVTALSRIALWRWIELATKSGGNIYYCDTDSIMTDSDLSEYCTSKLGGIKDEGSGKIFSGEFIQPKFYILRHPDGDKICMKGYKNKTIGEFEKVKLGEVVSYDTLEKVGSMVKRGLVSGPQMRTIIRSIRTPDMKRTHINGITYPLVIDEEPDDYL